MKESDAYSELASIRSMMERSTKFISLSGLSGVMAGIYAMVGAYMGRRLLQSQADYTANGKAGFSNPEIWPQLIVIALAVLVFSIVSCLILTQKQSQKKREKSWNAGSKRMLSQMAVPLLTGGCFIAILIYKQEFNFVIPASLLFYGLSLIAGSSYTFSDIKWLGICQLILGLLSTLFVGSGFICWFVGFGVLHVLYGLIMHFKYKQ